MKKVYIFVLPSISIYGHQGLPEPSNKGLSHEKIGFFLRQVVLYFFLPILTTSIVLTEVQGQSVSCPLLTHNSYTDFNASSNSGSATTLWFNLHTKLSGQLAHNGDFVLFYGGTITFNGINASFGASATIPNGKIVADNSITAPTTYFDNPSSTWITRVPLSYKTSDIFIAGAAITSANGFTVGSGKSTTLKGNFYSNISSFSSSWFYGLACYQPCFTNNTVGSVNSVGGVPVNGKLAGTPNNLTGNLVAGGSGGGGSNFTGSYSSTDNFTACIFPMKLGKLVWNDLNHNGLRDPGEPLLSGIIVNLYQDANQDNMPDGPAIATTTTNTEGNYTFPGWLPGKYIIGVTIPAGFSAGDTTSTSANPNNNDSTDNNGVRVVGSELRSNSISLQEGVDGIPGNLTVDFAFRLSLNTLPVTFTEFNAYAEKKTAVILQWVTANQTADSYFSIERSQDDQNFLDIGKVIGSANNFNSSPYEFKDDLAGVNFSRTIFYRIKQTDPNGKSLYSPVKAIALGGNENVIKMYPNPFADKMVINYDAEANGIMNCKIINMNGQTLITRNADISTGLNSIIIDHLATLVSGMYLLEISVNGKTAQYLKILKN